MQPKFVLICFAINNRNIKTVSKRFFFSILQMEELKRQLGFYLIVRTFLDFPNRYIKRWVHRSSTEHTQLSKMNNGNVKSKQGCSSTNTHLPGRLFSPSDVWKYYRSTFYCIFHLVWVSRKILGCIYLAGRKHFFFIRVPPLCKFLYPKGEPL